MKRFSKIFCVALVASVLLITNIVIFGNNKIVFAATISESTNIKCELDQVKDAGWIAWRNLPKGDLSNYENTCFSKSIELLGKISQKTQMGTTYSGINDIDNALGMYFDPTTCTAPSCTDLSIAYNKFISEIPTNDSFDNSTSTAKSLSVWLGEDYTKKDATYIQQHQNDPDPNFLISGGVTGTPNVLPEECSDDNPSFIGCAVNLPLCLFRYINIGIIHLTALIIKMGVNTMGWLMQPNNLWAPGISNNPAVIQAFGASVSVVNIVFSVVLVMMAIGTILNLKSYKINDLITKFIIVALLINFTLVIAGSILDLANYISLYFYNATLKSIQGTLTDKWTEILTNKVCLSGAVANTGRMFTSIFINLLVFIAIAAAMLSVCGSLLKRGIMLMFLLIISPFAVICYLLPVKGMGQWWEKWKTSFLQQTFYGVYVSVGFYLGTIMLSALSISNQLSDEGGELSFASGIIKPILAAGYLVFIVLLADEVAGGSAKASITGATKLALGVAGGAALAGATGIVTKIGTSKQVSELATNLSKRGGLSAALGTRLSSFNKTSQGKTQESRKAVEAKLANENPEAYKGKVDNLLQRFGKGETLNARDSQLLAASLNVLPDKQRKSLSSTAQAAIPSFTDSMSKAGVLSKPEQKDINATVPVKAATFKARNDYQKASDALVKERKGKNDLTKIAQFERDQQAAITDNASDIINVFRRYREDDPRRKDDIVQSVKDLNLILTSADPDNVRLQESIYDGLLMSNDPKSVCNMIDQIMKTKALDVSAEISGRPDITMRTAFLENMVQELLHTNNAQVQNIMREASKEIHNPQLAGALGVTQTSARRGSRPRRNNNGPVGQEESNENEAPTDSNNDSGE